MARCRKCNTLLTSLEKSLCGACAPLAAAERATGKPHQACLECGKIFPSPEGVLEFWCCERCADNGHQAAASWEAVDQAEGRVVMHRDCVACGIEFATPDGFGDFCTRECADASEERD